MSLVTASDISLIAARINLSKEKTALLLEEEHDLNLVLEQICKSYVGSKFKQFSFPIQCKLLVLRYSDSKQFLLSEKMYVAGAVAKHFPRLNNRINIAKIVSKELSEEAAQYYLVLSGFFNTQVNTKYVDDKHLQVLEHAFKRNERRVLGDHIVDWVIILRQIQNEGALNSKKLLSKTSVT